MSFDRKEILLDKKGKLQERKRYPPKETTKLGGGGELNSTKQHIRTRKQKKESPQLPQNPPRKPPLAKHLQYFTKN